MIRMKVFKLSMTPFDYSHEEKRQQNKHSEAAQANYKIKLEQRQDEYTPIEEFIDKIGFENIRKITTAGDLYFLAYTIFYEDNGRGAQ